MTQKRFFSVSAYLAVFTFLTPLFPMHRLIPAGAGDLLTAVLLLLPVHVCMLGSVLIPAAVFGEKIPFRLPTREDLRYLFFIPLLYAGISLLNGVLSGLLRKNGVPPTDQELVKFALHGSPGVFAFLLVSTIILAPLSEELVFRFVIRNFLCQCSLSDRAACVISSIVFALMHGLLQQSLGLFILGCCLQMGADSKGGGVSRSILMHSLFNLCGFACIAFFRLCS